MSNTKDIKRRISSVANTKKITRAMEMVAAAKMRKATEAVLATRTYANLSWTTVINISQSVNAGKYLHPLLSERKEVKKEAIILMASNRGLCGGFNSAIVQKAVDSIRKHGTSEQELTKNFKKEIKKDVDFIVVGKRGMSVKSRWGCNVAAEFEKADVCYKVKEVMPIAKMAIDDFLSQKYDKVMVAYTDFITPAKQVPRVKQLLPIDLEAKDHHLGILGDDPRVGVDKEFVKEKEDKYLKNKGNSYLFTYEPNAEEVLNEMLPRLIEIQLFQALLESNASEHSARMNAMHQATDASNDLINELTLYYNKARQAAITNEISEIVAGVNALSD